MINNDYVILYHRKKNKWYLINLKGRDFFDTHRGRIKSEDIIKAGIGNKVYTNTGEEFLIIRPSLCDYLTKIKRQTQVMYAKDIGYILMNLNLFSKARVLEIGTGSGAMTQTLALFLYPEGKIYTFDQNMEFQNIAKKNVAKLGVSDIVEFETIIAGEKFNIPEQVDAAVIDLPSPWEVVTPLREVLKDGCSLISLSPTSEQVKHMCKTLEENNYLVLWTREILMRDILVRQKQGVRPADRMISHTGYLTKAVKLGENG